ncbi:hypothetical protein CF327_g6463 [Tilletia walkeri]|uniref:FCP1 homology domain-containing protein n=1 Tax=Tilletia walkeri TaxID=117179 RepID=A0A8X7T3H5_9BASI|nr:hypothetical protein CF327_g6463 [Tilletia walkeri]KAE8266788.1 hypothetical protein A4X09_0g5559 [Tilletia walkeri]
MMTSTSSTSPSTSRKRPRRIISQPYSTYSSSFAVPITELPQPPQPKKPKYNHPFTPSTIINPGMRSSIRPAYNNISSQPSTTSQESHPLLLLLDLNGTLLYRPNRASSSGKASANPIHRPFLRSFLLYALGIPSEHEEDLARKANIERSILHTIPESEWPSIKLTKKQKENQNLHIQEALYSLNSLHDTLTNPTDIDDEESNNSHPSETSSNEKVTNTSDIDPISSKQRSRYGPWTPFPPNQTPNPEAHKPRLNLIIWSSAKPDNVHKMARSIFLPTWDEPRSSPALAPPPPPPSADDDDKNDQEEETGNKKKEKKINTRLAAHVGIPPTSQSSVALLSRIQNIWSRDTLVPINSGAYHHKVPCLKDLEIVWYALNVAGPKAQPSQGSVPRGQIYNRLSALERQFDDRERSDSEALDWVPDPSMSDSLPQLGKTPGRGSAAAEAAYLASLHGPWSAKNTLLLDDSPLKAALQPYNHLCVPEFDDQGAKRAKLVREELAKRYNEAQGVEMWEQDLVVAGDGEMERVWRETDSGGEVWDAKVDDVLLQLVGVLEEAKGQSNVAGWIRSGAVAGFGAGLGASKEAAQGKATRRPTSSESAGSWRKSSSPGPSASASAAPVVTAREWAQKGRNALKRLGIPLLL